MSQSREQLKSYFERGDTPTSEQFSQLIDSGVNQADDGISVTEDQQVGIGSATPQSRLAVGGNLTVGRLLAHTETAPPSGVLSEGPLRTQQSVQLATHTDPLPQAPGHGQLYVRQSQRQHLSVANKGCINLTSHAQDFMTLVNGTLSLWYKPLDNATRTQYVFWVGNSQGINGGRHGIYLLLGPDTGAYEDESLVYCQHRAGDPPYRVYVRRGHDYFTQPRWYHIAVVSDGPSVRIYLDGVEQILTVNQPGDPGKARFLSKLADNPVDGMYWGKSEVDHAAITQYFTQGYLDELAIIDRPLATTEIEQLYQQGRTHSLVALLGEHVAGYWRIGQSPSFPTIQDYSGKQRYGHYEGPLDPHPLRTVTDDQLYFQDSQGNEISLSGATGQVSGESRWGRKGENLYYQDGRVGLGTTDPRGQLHVVGDSYLGTYQGTRKVWVATGNGPVDETDFGRINSRTLRFYKSNAQSVLLITYTDNFRAEGVTSAVGRWTVRIDEQDTQPRATLLDWYANSYNYVNFHLPGIVKGLAYSIPQGEHEISVWVGDVPGHENHRKNRYTGWAHCTWMIEVEEVMLHQLPSS